MGPAQRGVDTMLPGLDPWVRNLLVGLLGVYLVQLTLEGFGVPTLSGALWPFGAGFAPWQLVTHVLVESPTQPMSVVVGLVVLYFVLPTVDGVLGRRALVEGLLATFATATVLTLACFGLEAAGVAPPFTSAVHGWTGLDVALFCWFGLAMPSATVRLNFVVPVPAVWFVWGSLGVAVLFVYAALATGAPVFPPLHTLFLWVGAYGWWQLRGPGSRRRRLKAKARAIEAELNRPRGFRVIDGGRS